MVEEKQKIIKAVNPDGFPALYNSGVLEKFLNEHPGAAYDKKSESTGEFSEDIRLYLHVGVEFPDENKFNEFYKNKIEEFKKAVKFLEKTIGERVKIE